MFAMFTLAAYNLSLGQIVGCQHQVLLASRLSRKLHQDSQQPSLSELLTA